MNSDTNDEALASDARAASRWLGLAFGVLIPAGLFALAIVVARTPWFTRFVTDPMFFRRCLVVHVDLSLLVWSYAFVAALFFLLPSRKAPQSLSRTAGVAVSTAGVVAMMLGAGVPHATPLLTNYIPTIDHPLFSLGLFAFAVGLLLTFVDSRLLPGNEARDAWMPIPASARPGIRAAVLAILVAFVTLILSAAVTPSGLSPQTRNELMFWGGGHILQVALEAAMLAVWLLLLGGVLGRDPVGRGTAAVLFGLLLLPTLAAPALTLRGTTSGLYRTGFTMMMQWGIFPVTLAFVVLCARAIVRARAEGRRWGDLLGDGRSLGFLTSVSLTLVAFVLGALIRGSTTLVPAHYHAATGAVTVSFMTFTYVLLERFRAPVPTPRLRALARWQPAAYGFGQLVFVAGFGLAGAHGMARKAYGAEQHVRGAADRVGMSLMGLGGTIAVIGGVLFLWIVVAAWRRRAPAVSNESRRNEWKTTPESIHSRG